MSIFISVFFNNSLFTKFFYVYQCSFYFYPPFSDTTYDDFNSTLVIFYQIILRFYEMHSEYHWCLFFGHRLCVCYLFFHRFKSWLFWVVLCFYLFSPFFLVSRCFNNLLLIVLSFWFRNRQLLIKLTFTEFKRLLLYLIDLLNLFILGWNTTDIIWVKSKFLYVSDFHFSISSMWYVYHLFPLVSIDRDIVYFIWN